MSDEWVKSFMRAQEALERKWDKEKQPKERYEITFTSGWRGCGDAMCALSRDDLEDVTWTHREGAHSVQFTCTFHVLKEVQLAVKGSPVSNLRCHRLMAPGVM